MSGIGFSLEPEEQDSPVARRRLLLVVGICIVLLLTILGTAVAIGGHRLKDLLGPAADYSGNGSGSAQVTVNPGDNALDIGNALKRAGVVKSAQAFRDAASED